MSETIDPNNLTLDNFNYFWMSNGAPCFIANNWNVVDDICEAIESFGFQIYYLICDKADKKTVSQKDAKGVMVSTQVYEYEPAILKVVNNFTGRVVMPSNDTFGNNFAAVEEVAHYNMPPIPRIIVDKLDEFFRLVDAQHHTESIVILTYDTTKQGSDGWGVLVPDQTNTSVHCKYDADSIAEIKPDHVMIVGSVHSHPGMAAYASGTDHADQADFDGIHITYGWQNSVNGGATQYHIELQIGGAAYTLKPEDVFESFTINKEPDPEVVEWTTKVKKVAPLYTGGSVSQDLKIPQALNQSYQTTWANQTHNSPLTQTGTANTGNSDWYAGKQKFLKELSIVEPDAIVAIEIDTIKNQEVDCLICNFPLTKMDIESLFCMTCDTPVITEEMNQFDIISSIHAYCSQRYLDPTVAYYIYCHDPNSNFLVKIKDAGLDPVSQGSDYVSDDPTLEPEIEFTVCCNIPVSASHECRCQKTVYESHIGEFDLAHANTDIYVNDGKCYDCAHYYDTSCPAFRTALIDFVTHDKVVSQPITHCDTFIHYKERQQSLTYSIESSYYND